jgi:hypothetical protein
LTGFRARRIPAPTIDIPTVRKPDCTGLAGQFDILCDIDRFANRVTKLGEFSPIGWLLILGSFLKITEIAQVVVATYFRCKSFVLVLRKDGLGNTLGDFFVNASGHPVRRCQNQLLLHTLYSEPG